MLRYVLWMHAVQISHFPIQINAEFKKKQTPLCLSNHLPPNVAKMSRPCVCCSHCSAVLWFVHGWMSAALINIKQHTIDCSLLWFDVCDGRAAFSCERAAPWAETTDISRNGDPAEKQEGMSKRGMFANWEGEGGRLFNSRMMGRWRGEWRGTAGRNKKKTKMLWCDILEWDWIYKREWVYRGKTIYSTLPCSQWVKIRKTT